MCASFSLPDLERHIESYLIHCDIERHSARTITESRDRLGRLVWFAKREGYTAVGKEQVELFFVYLNHGHKEPGGRWSDGTEADNRHGRVPSRETRPLSSGRVKAFYTRFSAFFTWCVHEEYLTISPMAKMKSPVDRPDQIEPFTEEQVNALLAAARKARNARRDEAILLLLLDTGARLSELCALTVGDVSLEQNLIKIRFGKGGKARSAPFGSSTKKALFYYLRDRIRPEDEEPLFLAERGNGAGGALTDKGVQLVIKRIGQAAGIDGVRCSPHTFRHTFSILYLRAGGNVFTLKTILGHESLYMTQRYVAIAQADVRNAHKQFSPVESIKKGKANS